MRFWFRFLYHYIEVINEKYLLWCTKTLTAYSVLLKFEHSLAKNKKGSYILWVTLVEFREKIQMVKISLFNRIFWHKKPL